MGVSLTVRKVITWRILSFTIATLLMYPFIGSFMKSIGLTVFINIVMTVVHYFFERYWLKKYPPKT